MRVRYGRLSAAGTAFVVSLVALLAGVGILPVSGSAAFAGSSAFAGSATGGTSPAPTPSSSGPTLSPLAPAPSASPVGPSPDPASASPTPTPTPTPTSTPSPSTAADEALPDSSGSGTRVVFDISDQRVWLVRRQDGQDQVLRTYLVSGSLTDNLSPGTYSVYSRSRYAVGVDDSGTMQYFVRFTRGQNAAIGFHDIPVKDGSLVQTRAQLGTPQSHGCIRQYRPDAIALWDFAPLGRSVVVTA